MHRTNVHAIAALLAGASMLWGCRDDAVASTDAGRADSGVARDGAADASSPADAAADAGATGCAADGNDTPETAADAALGVASGVVQGITCPGDVDYFAFDGFEGDFIRIYVRPMHDPMGREIDPVLTLFDDAGAKLAENDDGREGSGPVGTHPLIITRLRATGRYVIRVDDFRHWSGTGTPIGDPGLLYTLYAVRVATGDPDAVVDAETGDGAASALPLVFSIRRLPQPVEFGYAVGTFRDATDVDVFSFDVAGSATSVLFSAAAHEPGPDASGSTVRVGHLWITDATGTTVIARTDTSAAGGLWRVQPTLPVGSYLLWLDRSSGAPGANDFYALGVTRGPENAPESDDTANGTLAGAQAMTFDMLLDGRMGYFLSLLPTVTDVDYFAFDLAAGETMSSVSCFAAWDGSGVRGFSLEVRDGADAVLAREAEDDVLPANVLLMGAETGITAPGRYYLRLGKTGQDPAVSGTFARCEVGILAAP